MFLFLVNWPTVESRRYERDAESWRQNTANFTGCDSDATFLCCCCCFINDDEFL